MDELRNMLRQSFNLPVEPVGVVDERKGVDDRWSAPGKNYDGIELTTINRSGAEVWKSNFGNIFEPLLALCVASYIYNGTILRKEITDAAGRLSYKKKDYDVSELFNKMSDEERRSEEERNIKNSLGRQILKDIVEAIPEMKNDDLTNITPLHSVIFVKSGGKNYYVAIHGLRMPGSGFFYSDARRELEPERIKLYRSELQALSKAANPRQQSIDNAMYITKVKMKDRYKELAIEKIEKEEEEIKNRLTAALKNSKDVYDCEAPVEKKWSGGAGMFFIYKIFADSEKNKATAFAKVTDTIKENILERVNNKSTNVFVHFQFLTKGKEEVMYPVPMMQYFIDNPNTPIGIDGEEDGGAKKTNEEKKQTGLQKINLYIDHIVDNIDSIGPIKEAKKYYDSIRDSSPRVDITTIGSEGMESDTSGEIKGDVTLDVGENQYRLSLKAGNKTVASMGNNHLFFEYINKAFMYAGLSKASPWNPDALGFAEDKSKTLDREILITFQSTCVDLKSDHKNKLLFTIFDTLAHGLDDATLVSLTTTGQSGKIKTISPSISEYIRAMNAETIVTPQGEKIKGRQLGTKFTVVDRDEPSKKYGILNISKDGKVEINGDLEKLLEELKNVFGPDADEDRKMLWAICRQVSYCKIIKQKIAASKLEISRPITIKIDFYHKQVNNILNLYGSSKLHDEAISNKVTTENYIDSLTKLKLYDYAFGKSNKVDERILHSFLVGMANKLHMYLTSMEASMKKLKVPNN
jgi:hypothetical protein